MGWEIICVAAGSALLVGILIFRLLEKSVKLDQGLFQPVAKQAWRDSSKLWGSASSTLERFAPLDRARSDELGRTLALSGSSWTPAQLWAMQLAGAVMGASLGLAVAGKSGTGIVVGVALGLVGFAGPRLAVILSRRRWHRELSRELPDMLDLLSVAVSSGSTLDDGLRIVASSMEGALAEACGQVVARANQEPVAKGFERFAANTGLSDLATVGHAVAHATDSGSPVSKVLVEQAKRLRNLRKLQVDEDSAKLDNQITVVCGLLVMPAAFASALLPYVWSIIQQFGSI